MSYAVRNDGKGWRAVNSADDLGADEYFSETIPVKTNAQLKREELQALASVFDENQKDINAAWLAAAVADGINENTRKDAVLADAAELQTQYDADVSAVRAKYA